MQRFCFIALILACLGSIQSSQAQAFRVEGVTTYEIQTKGAIDTFNGSNPISYSFALEVQGCKFRIEVNSSRRKYETTFDDSLYQVITMTNGNKVSRQAKVDSNPIPQDDGTTQNCLWLAYASSCFFSNVHTSRLPPIWMLDDTKLREEGFTTEARWETISSKPSLPLDVVYLSDGIHRGSDRQGNQRQTFRYPAPFDKGFTNAIYRVNTTTNVGNLVLPSQSTFTRYYVDGNQVWIRARVEITATNVQDETPTNDFRPKLTGTAEPALSFAERKQAIREVAEAAPQKQPQPRNYILGIMILLPLALVGFYFWSRKELSEPA